jgi:hypothetical protein
MSLLTKVPNLCLIFLFSWKGPKYEVTLHFVSGRRWTNRTHEPDLGTIYCNFQQDNWHSLLPVMDNTFLL